VRLPGVCPADQTLAAFVDGLLPDTDRAVAVEHVDRCAACLERVAELAALTDAPTRPVPSSLIEVAARPPARWIRQVMPYGAVAAGVLLAVSLWPTPEPERPTATPPLSASPASSVRTSAAGAATLVVEAPRDNQRLAPGFEVRWQGPSSTVFYEVQLTTPDGDLLWSADVNAATSSTAVPTHLSETQTAYLWVTAHLPEGRRLTSNVIRVRGR
jgi:hypothetical protein